MCSGSRPDQKELHINPQRVEADLRCRNYSPIEQLGDKWSELWDSGYSPWDRGTPNPALVDLLAQWESHGFFTAHEALKTRRRALIPVS